MKIRWPNCGEISVLVMAVLILIYIGIKTNWGHPQPEVSGDRCQGTGTEVNPESWTQLKGS